MAQIKKDPSLRKAILQAAITGQLISSCHSELDSEFAETGKELLTRIIEERNNKLLAEWEEALKKNPKAKNPVPVVASEIEEEEIPYGIECKSELATGNIIVHISNDKLGSIMIPLPPLEEQEEIVKKVEELLPLCK